MSGQLVGEVIDALEACAIKLDLPQRLVLIAIAEKCHHVTRQGQVRVDRIQAATGKSLRTTRRYVAELRDAELIRVVKRGYKAPNAGPVAPIYELSELVPSKAAQAQEKACAKSDKACAKSDKACAIDPTVTSGVATIDGSIDGSIDGGARASAAPPPPHLIPEEPPQRTCTKHSDWNGDPCRICGSDRDAYNAWLTDSRRLLAALDYQRDRATGTEAAAISDQRRRRIAVFQRIGEPWK